jgi:hypothetical protein
MMLHVFETLLKEIFCIAIFTAIEYLAVLLDWVFPAFS